MEPDKTAPPSENGETPEKYIRTFSSDMDIYQKGGTPGLAPLKTTMPTPAERLVAGSPVQPVPVAQIKIPTIVPVAIPTTAPAPVSIPAAILTPAPVLPPPPIDTFKAIPLQTYAEDFRARVKETHASTATILAAEQDAAPRVQVEVEKPPQNNHNAWYIAAGVTLLIAGSVGVYIAYSHFLTTTAPVLIAPGVATPIFVDDREVVSGTGMALVQAIKQSVAKPLALNTVRLLSYESATASSSVFSSLSVSAPLILIRNVDAAGSMAGIVNTTSGQSPFFILSVGSYSTTFSGMLSWEPTMQISLNALFPQYPAPIPVIPVVATTTVATTTKATAKTPTKTPVKTPAPVVATTTPVAPVVIGFRDEVVSNHDVRVYRDALGRSILIYGYWNQSTLIIARDPAAFLEILGRLATSHP